MQIIMQSSPVIKVNGIGQGHTSIKNDKGLRSSSNEGGGHSPGKE